MSALVERLRALAERHERHLSVDDNIAAGLEREAAARIEALEKALGLALAWLAPLEPGDSRAVSNEFVAMASVHADLSNDECVETIDKALAALSEPHP